MNADRQAELLKIGNDSANVLSQFVALQNEKTRIARSIQPIDFKQHRFAVLTQLQTIDAHLSRLETLARHPATSTIEEDYISALGTYLCDVRNAMSRYEYMTRVQDGCQGFRWFLGFGRLFSSVRGFKKAVDKYLDSGIELKALWTIYKNAQRGGSAYSSPAAGSESADR